MVGARISAVAVLMLAILPAAPVAAAEPFACPDVNATITAGTDRERALICAGTADAADFLAACGIARSAPLVVTVHQDMREVCDTPAHALYDRNRDSLEIAALDTCLRTNTGHDLFARIGASTAYRSIAAHEAAHAIFSQAGVPSDRIAAQEYVAGAVQFASLPPGTRDDLTTALVAPRSRHVEIPALNVFVYAMAPLRYAAMASLHLGQQPDRCAFLQDLAAGRVILRTTR
jgi:hypothetical protein